MKASFSLERVVTGWRQSNTTGKMLREKVVVRQFARANNAILGGDFPPLHITETADDIELENEAKQ